MKSFEAFLGKMMGAARLTQAHDPRAATDVIQAALRQAGLLQDEAVANTGSPPPGMVDLNAVPDWAQATSARSAKGARARRHGTARPTAPAHDPRAPGQFTAGSFSAAAGTRGYKLYEPSQPASGPRPLIVMLHGCTQNPDDFAAGTAMNALAEERGCLVLYPEQARSANATLCWNWFETPHQQREGGEPALIAGMTREVIATHGADPGRVYVAGLSAGGAMAAIMGATYPELYAAVGVHSGLPVGKARDLITGLAAMKKGGGGAGRSAGRVRQQVPVIIFHGDRDDIVHAENGDAVMEQFLAAAAARATLRRSQERHQRPGGRGYTKTSVRDSADRSVAEHWELHGAGHAWSGGNPAGTYTDPAGPDASAEMLRFFLAQAT